MNVNYINPMLEATTSVLSTMAQLELQPGKPRVLNDSLTIADVTGIIDLKGKQINGWLAVGFYEDTILKIAEKMLREEFRTIDHMVVDLVGELTNMICGSAKAIYDKKGLGDIEMALPHVVVGKGKTMGREVFGSMIVLPFSSDVGEFSVVFSLS